MSNEADGLVTYQWLEERWMPSGPTPEARRRWIIRRCREWGLRPLNGWRGARFLKAAVLKAEANAAKSGFNRYL